MSEFAYSIVRGATILNDVGYIVQIRGKRWHILARKFSRTAYAVIAELRAKAAPRWSRV